MKVCITTTNREVGDHIYDLLTNPLSGCGCLLGSKTCIDDHNMVPDVMEFDLNEDEVNAIREMDGVISVNRTDLSTFSLDNNAYVKVRQPDAVYRSASYASCDNAPSTAAFPRTARALDVNLAPEHLYYSISGYKATFNQDNPASGLLTSFSVDCSNVDILLIDTGVDPTCEDLKNSFGDNLVQEFNWSQLTDPEDNNRNILEKYGFPDGMPNNYYIDAIGHGTACASTIAGLKCGLAKNARIYTLNVSELGAPFGFPLMCCLNLALGFIYAKKNNSFGLSSSRPTVCSNSWSLNGALMSGILGPSVLNRQPADNPNGIIVTDPKYLGPIAVPAGKTKPISALGSNLAGRENSNNITNGNNNDGIVASSFDVGTVRYSFGDTGTQHYDSLPFCSKVAANDSQFDYFFSANDLEQAAVLPAASPAIDGYFRKLLDQGVHCLVSAGNSNLELNKNAPVHLPMITFRKKEDKVEDERLYSVLRQRVLDNDGLYKDNLAGLVEGTNYSITDIKGTGTYTLVETNKIVNLSYQSPDIGENSIYSRNNYPLIKVGCISPIGNRDPANQTFDTGGYSRAIYNVINGGINGVRWLDVFGRGQVDAFKYNDQVGYIFIDLEPTREIGILYNDGFNNTNLAYGFSNTTNKFTAPFYVKSPYSCFGPDVDIYAVGSANWAAFSNQTYNFGTNKFQTATGEMSGTQAPPYFRDPVRNAAVAYGTGYRGKYIFANGTSSSCPAVAGVLATFLASRPNATPLEARNWLTSTSIKGAIMTTARTTPRSTISGIDPVAGGYGVTTNGTTLTSIKLPSLGIKHTWGYFGPSIELKRGSTFAMPAYTLRNSNYNQVLSAFYDKMNKTSYPADLTWTTMLYDVLFQCRFFNNSNNRIAQAHPLRKAAFSATTGTRYASAMYLNRNNINTFATVLEIRRNNVETYVTHSNIAPAEYIIGTTSAPNIF